MTKTFASTRSTSIGWHRADVSGWLLYLTAHLRPYPSQKRQLTIGSAFGKIGGLDQGRNLKAGPLLACICLMLRSISSSPVRGRGGNWEPALQIRLTCHERNDYKFNNFNAHWTNIGLEERARGQHKRLHPESSAMWLRIVKHACSKCRAMHCALESA